MSSGRKLILRTVGMLILILFVALVSYELGERHGHAVYIPTLVKPLRAPKKLHYYRYPNGAAEVKRVR